MNPTPTSITDIAEVTKLPSAAKIAADVRSGARSAVDHLKQVRANIAAADEHVHAYLHLLDERADKQAQAVDQAVAAGEDPGPLAGVPVALKDNMCVRSEPTTCSSKILEGWRPPYDATVVQRLESAGAVLVGKTNLDEFAMGSSTENSAFGPTRNPLDLQCVPGGSSGGSAAAVSAGFAALSLGSDTGGSIRQPAALCGLVGVKPSYGAVSRYGLIAFASSLDQIGPFAHTVQDAALCFEAISGHDKADATSLPNQLESSVAAVTQGVEGKRIGVIEELSGEGIDADVLECFHASIKALEDAGAIVERVSIPAAIYGLGAYYVVAPAEASSNLARFDGVRYGNRVDGANVMEMNTNTRTAGFGPEVKRRIMLGTYALSAGYYDAYYGKAQRTRTLIAQEFDAAYERFDLLMSPTTPSTAFKFGAKTDPMALYMCDVCTIPSNLSGHPAISVPFGVGEDGLPVGVQFLAPMLQDARMFSAAAVLEDHNPNSPAMFDGDTK